MRSAAELRAQRAITAAFVDANYQEIVLIPQIETKTSTGGKTWTDGAPRAPQRFHVIERVSSARIDTRVPGGEMRAEDFTLLGYWDAEIEVKDHFYFQGGHWEIQSIEFENGYERRASVIRYGR